jgi:hypothetical protein
MGNLASQLPLEAGFEHEYLFPVLLDAGCRVYDIVSFALTCKDATLFVRHCVSCLSRPRLNQLLLSTRRKVQNNARLRRYLPSFTIGRLMWEVSTEGIHKVRIIRPEVMPPHGKTWDMHIDYGTVLTVAVANDEPIRWNPFVPLFLPHAFQWFPLLDDALYTAIRCLDAAQALAKDDHAWERARKRLRTECVCVS